MTHCVYLHLRVLFSYILYRCLAARCGKGVGYGGGEIYWTNRGHPGRVPAKIASVDNKGEGKPTWSARNAWDAQETKEAVRKTECQFLHCKLSTFSFY